MQIFVKALKISQQLFLENPSQKIYLNFMKTHSALKDLKSTQKINCKKFVEAFCGNAGFGIYEILMTLKLLKNVLEIPHPQQKKKL
jgi:hypothetical protein